jgi:hypothetical protein
MHPSTVEAFVAGTIAVALNLAILVAMAQMWQRRHDLMVSTNWQCLLASCSARLADSTASQFCVRLSALSLNAGQSKVSVSCAAHNFLTLAINCSSPRPKSHSCLQASASGALHVVVASLSLIAVMCLLPVCSICSLLQITFLGFAAEHCNADVC